MSIEEARSELFAEIDRLTAWVERLRAVEEAAREVVKEGERCADLNLGWDPLDAALRDALDALDETRGEQP